MVYCHFGMVWSPGERERWSPGKAFWPCEGSGTSPCTYSASAASSVPGALSCDGVVARAPRARARPPPWPPPPARAPLRPGPTRLPARPTVSAERERPRTAQPGPPSQSFPAPRDRARAPCAAPVLSPRSAPGPVAHAKVGRSSLCVGVRRERAMWEAVDDWAGRESDELLAVLDPRLVQHSEGRAAQAEARLAAHEPCQRQCGTRWQRCKASRRWPWEHMARMRSSPRTPPTGTCLTAGTSTTWSTPCWSWRAPWHGAPTL